MSDSKEVPEGKGVDDAPLATAAAGAGAGAGVAGTGSAPALAITSADREADVAVKEAEAAAERGDDVRVRFVLEGAAGGVDVPDLVAPVGQLVAGLKLHVQNSVGIAIARQQMFLDGSVMIDPLSLADFPAITPTSVTTVTVRVKPEEGDDA